MESTDLKNELPDDAQLEAWYRTHLATPPLRDDGFSRRVLAALPTPARRLADKRRLFCLVGALTGILVAWFGQLATANIPVDSFPRESELARALLQLANPALGLAIGITLISLWFVFRPKVRLLPRF